MENKDLELLKNEILGVEELVEEQPVEKTEDPETTTAPTADPESGASSLETTSSELADLKKELVTDPPKKYKHVPIENLIDKDIETLQTSYPNFKINKTFIGGAIEVINIQTGEKQEFFGPQSTGVTGRNIEGLSKDKDQEYIDFKNFIEANDDVSEESKYIHQMTGLIPEDNEYKGFEYEGTTKNPYSLIKRTEQKLNLALDEYAESISFGLPNSKGERKQTYELLMNKKADYNSLSQEAKNQINASVINMVKKDEFLNITDDDVKSILTNNKFISNINYNRDQAVSEQMVDIVDITFDLSKDADKQEFIDFKKRKENEFTANLNAQQKARLKQIENLNKQRDSEDLTLEETVDLKNAPEKLETLFNNDGSFNGATEAEQQTYTLQQQMEYLIASLSSDFDNRTTKEKFKDNYDIEVLQLMKNEQIGNKRFIDISPALLNNLKSKASLNELPIAIVSELGSFLATIGDDEKTRISYSKLAKYQISPELLKKDQALLGVEEEDFRGYTAWLDDKKQHEQAMLGAFNVINLEQMPDRNEEFNPFVNFFQETIKAFQTGTFYGARDTEYSSNFNRALFGSYSPVETLDAVEASFNSYNERNPDSEIKLSPKQKENFKQGIAELTSTGLGGMVPFLMEMFVVGAATEGVGVFRSFGKVGQVIDAMLLEELKFAAVPSTPLEPGAGATFTGAGMLASKIPIGPFKTYFTGLRPFYEKVIKAGWVGAASSQANKFVRVFADDLLGHTPWRTAFENNYGDLLSGDDEAFNEFTKETLVDAFIFGISGVSHLRKGDFQSVSKKKKVLSSLIDKNSKELNAIREEFSLDNSEFKKMSGEEFIEALQNADLSKAQQERFTKLQESFGLQTMLSQNIQHDIKFEDYNNIDLFEKNLANPVTKRLTANAEAAGAKAPKFKFEFTDANNPVLAGAPAKVIAKGGEYRVVFSRESYNAGRAGHELQHLVDLEYYRLNPEAKESIRRKAGQEEILLSKVDNIKVTVGDKTTNESLIKLLQKIYPELTKAEILEKEYKTNLIELFSDKSNLLIENPIEASTWLGELKRDFLDLKRSMFGSDAKLVEIRTVEDLMIQINNLTRDLNRGTEINDSTLDIMEALSKTKLSEIGLTKLNKDAESIKTEIELAEKKAPKDFEGDIVVPTQLESKSVLENLEKEVREKGEFKGKDEKGNDQYTPDPSTVSKILAETYYKAEVMANNPEIWIRHGSLRMPKDQQVRDDVAGELMVELVKYANRYDGRGSVDGYLNWALNKQWVNALNRAGVYDNAGKVEFDENKNYNKELGGEDSWRDVETQATEIRTPNIITNRTPKTVSKAIEGGYYNKDLYNNVAKSISTGSDISTNYKDTFPRSGIIEMIEPSLVGKIVDQKTGQVNTSATEIGKKLATKVFDKLGINKEVENADQILTGIIEILPSRSSVPYNEVITASGESIVASDAQAGLSSGIQTKLLESPLYERKGREKDPQGNPIYEKIKQEDLTPEKLQEIRDYFNTPNTRNNSTKLRNLIYQIDKAVTNSIEVSVAKEKILKDAFEIGDMMGATSLELNAAGISESIREELADAGYDFTVQDLNKKVNNFVLSNSENTEDLDFLIKTAVIKQIKIEKDGDGFIKVTKEKMPDFDAPLSFSSKKLTKEQAEAARDEHAEQFIKFVESPFFGNVFNVGKFPGSKQTLPFLLAKFNDAKRTVGNAGSERGKKVLKALENTKEISEDILLQDSEFANAIKQLNKDIKENNIEAANSIVGANTKTQDIFNIVTGLKNGQVAKVIQLEGRDGKTILWNPDGKFEFKQTEGVEIVKGSTKLVKENLINKVYDPKIAKALKNYDFVINSALQKWYLSVPKKEKAAADRFLYRHFQMTTNTTFSDRAYAPLIGATLKDGIDEGHKKGEHVMDASMNTALKFQAIKNGKYNKAFHDLISSEYFQLLTDKQVSDVMDKEIGPNNTAQIFKMIKAEPENIYNFAEGEYYDQTIAKEYIKRDGNITAREYFNSNDIVGAILKNKAYTTYLNPDRGIENILKQKGETFAQQDRSSVSKNMARARKKTAEIEQHALDQGYNLVVDGTGAGYNATAARAKKYTDFRGENVPDGYEVSMVFINTSLETSLARNARRVERSLEPFIVERTWKQTEANRRKYKKLFGKNYFELDNNNLKQGETPQDFIDRVNAKFAIEGKKVVVMMAGSPGSGKSTVVEDLSLNAESLNRLSNQKLINRGRDPKEVVECSIGDFDDNVAFTDCKVLAKMGEIIIELDAQDFNTRKEALEKDGYTMSYEQFDQVIGAESGPSWRKWTEDYKRIGSEDMFIMTARAAGSQEAIFNYLKQKGYEIPIENIITTEGTAFVDGPLSGENKKAAEIPNFYIGEYNGKQYNKLNFSDDYFPNTDAVKFVTNQLDITGDVYTSLASKNISKEFNSYIDNVFKIDPNTSYSLASAKNLGASKDGVRFLSYGMEDFKGLLYATLDKGVVGERQFKFYEETLLDTYERGVQAFEIDMAKVNNSFKIAKKTAPKNLNEKVGETTFTNQDAVRVYLWKQSGEKIPGISDAEINKLVNQVESDPQLQSFAGKILEATGEGTYGKPTETWNTGNIAMDLMEIGKTVKRKKYLAEFLNNRDQIFNEDNKNKLRANLGNKYMDALENMFARMEAGTNRLDIGTKVGNRMLDIINNTNAVTMTLNTRSALLQTISAANYVNWSFNNPLKATAAFANIPQFAKDYITLMNDPFLTERRGGNKININEAEIAAAAKKNGYQGMLSYLHDKGYVMTKMADSFAISFGGASFYRNRINDLMSREKMSESDAAAQARLEWVKLARESQQSGDPSKIGADQASTPGRIMLAFANTPAQYLRLQARAAQDLKNGRGDTKANVSKILYYGFVQNLAFNALQQALFMADEDSITEKQKKTAMGMLDSYARGFGIGGNAFVVGKNIMLDLVERSERNNPEYIDAVQKLTQLSPGINSRFSKLKSAAYVYENKVEEMPGPVSFSNPLLQVTTNIVEGVAGISLERLRKKAQNLADATDEENDWLTRAALLTGYPKWQLVDMKKDWEKQNAKTGLEERKKQRESFFGGGTSDSENKDRSNFGF